MSCFFMNCFDSSVCCLVVYCVVFWVLFCGCIGLVYLLVMNCLRVGLIGRLWLLVVR